MENNIAQVKNTFHSLTEKENENAFKVDIFFQQQIIDSFSGPAFLTNDNFEIMHQNIYADALVDILNKKNAALYGLIVRCLTNNCPDNQKIATEDANGSRHYDLYAFPVKINAKKQQNLVLVFGKDTTVEQHLTKALVDSRQMFKDLVSCSTDFAWETDNKGRFKYVSPNGILGYTAYELNDKKASELIVGQGGINPFDTLDSINDVEIWMQRSDASFACIQVSASPIIDNHSKWQGARGVCRDITTNREHEAALRRIQKSERTLKKIISAIRDEIDPSKILNTTACETAASISAIQSYIVSIEFDEDRNVVIDHKADHGTIDSWSIYSKITEYIEKLCKKSQLDDIPEILEETINDHPVMIGFSKHHNKLNGALIVVNKENETNWNNDEKSLFKGIVSHLGIAFEQIRNYEQLEKLSRTDELSGLFNRRAFTEKVNKRLIIQKRQKHTCALLYVDLDNFKQINDNFGHAKGDEVLIALSEILKSNTREEDFCSRLGGDEFAVWLEDVNEQSAVMKAETILKSSDALKEIANNPEKPLSLSIGVALSNPYDDQTLDMLMEHADNALYEVKENGKSGVVVNK